MHGEQTVRWGKKAVWRRSSPTAVALALTLLSACAPARDENEELGSYATTKQPMVLAPGWVTGSTWPTETVVALNSVVARTSSLIDGDVAILTAATQFIDGTYELSLQTNAEVKGKVRADSLNLAIAGHVFGTAQYNALTGGGTIDGTKTTPLALPVNVTIVPCSNFSAGTTNTTVAAGATTTLSAGSFAAWTLTAGTRAAPTLLRLNAGTYNVNSITLNDYSRIECKGACEIRVKTRITGLGAFTYIGPGGGGTDQTYSEVKLFVEGTNSGSAPSSSPVAFSLGINSELHAYTFVPNGTLTMGAGSSGVGKFIAKDIDIGSGVELMTGTSSQRVLVNRWVVGPSWPSEVFTAFNSLDVLSNTAITGNATVLTNATSYLSTSEAVINSGSTLTGNLKADKIEVKSTARITGTATYNTLVNAGTVGGTVTSLALPQDQPHVPVFPLITTGGSKTTIGSRVDTTQAAGRFRDYILTAGTSTDFTTVNFTGGLYEVRNLTLGDYSSITCSAACEIRVKQKLTTGTSATIMAGVGLDVANVKIYVYANTGSTPSSTPFAASLGTNSTTQGLLFVSRGTLEAKGGALLNGRFIARDIRLGSASSSVKAGTTDTPVAIQTQPVDQSLVVGQNATFSVAATGTDATFQWQRNGIAISGATSGSYTLNSTALGDSGSTFRVVVSNSLGSVTSSTATLTVNSCDPMTYVSTPTTCGVGGCARTGTLSCVAGHVVDSCSPGFPSSDANCNGVDNDCSGAADEDYVPVATNCGAGACAATGITSCVNGMVQDSCTSSVPAANDTTCDGRDDDCNGQIDEDYVRVVTSCGEGACLRSGMTSCVSGAIVDSCSPGTPGNADSNCNGIDEDCDGEADQDYDSVVTHCGNGPCRTDGETDCVNGVVVDSCVPGTNAASDPTCNGVDDDCDGTADDNYVPVVSNCGTGVCARTGMTSCVSGTIQQNCTPGSPTLASDTTCNNQDEDCSGQKDEDYVVTPTSCGVGACVRSGQNVCSGGSVSNTCVAGTPAANDSVCNGVDDDCSGQTDEDYAAVPTSCGSGTCTGSGATSCGGGTVHDSCAVPTTDSDGDGTPNCADGCPNNAPKTAPGVCGCATADSDSDSDGLANCVDGCPLDAQNDADHDGQCGNVDACPLDAQNDVDGDGVCGNVDNCPDIANANQNDFDHNGAGDACDYYPLTSVAAGGLHSCGTLSSNEVICWGENGSGQLGNGTTTTSMSPVGVTGISDAQAVVAGHAHSCALRQGGQVVCWGANSKGQLGNNSTTSSNTPVAVSNLTDATQISAGYEHTCALRSTGQVVCWGSNKSDSQGGQLGNNTVTPSSVPVTVSGLVDAVEVSAGYAHACARRSTGAVVCWGANWYGQIGNGAADLHGPSTSTRVPVAVSGLTDAVHIDAGDLHNCAVRASGAVVCWGVNWYGQLGDGTTTAASTPVAVSGLTHASNLSAGQHHTCAVRTSGALRCWGYNPYGQLGNATVTDATVPQDVSGIGDATSVTLGELHSCVLRGNADAYCWGNAENGQLGHVTGARATTPGAVATLVNATQVALGSYHACALQSTGAVSCWGGNSDGALGSAAATDATAPRTVSGLSSVTALSVGDDFSCAMVAGGQVKCWGYGLDGQLGNGTKVSSYAPVTVSGISGASAISNGVAHACALVSGAVKCWGDNTFGQLGDGTKTTSSSPVSVSGISTATAIAAGNLQSCAVLSDGSVLCWGGNNHGQLGTGNNTPSNTPVAVQGVTNATAVATGDSQSCALRSTGQVMCWGANVLTATSISGVMDAVSVTMGSDHSCAVRSGGGVQCWGKNDEGQLGNGTTTLSSAAVSVSGLSSAVQANAGLYFSCAVRSFGTVYCWGVGDAGQLGNGFPWASTPMRTAWPVLH